MIIENKTNDEIIAMLEDDGADIGRLCEIVQADSVTLAQIIRASARNGTLVWTKKHIVSTHHTCPFEYQF
jgi:hypothetical protein